MGNQVPCERCGQTYEPSKRLRGQCPACLFAQTLPEGESPTGVDPTRFVPPKISELAPLFPQLTILELTGCGGMSAVYKASQTHLGRTVAIKVLPEAFTRDELLLPQLRMLPRNPCWSPAATTEVSPQNQSVSMGSSPRSRHKDLRSCLLVADLY